LVCGGPPNIVFFLWCSIAVHALALSRYLARVLALLLYLREKKLAPVLIGHWIMDVIAATTRSF
jgi:hypothetical protein